MKHLDAKEDQQRMLARFTAVERRLIASLRTPLAVQRWLRAQAYNREPGGETLRGFRGVARHRTAHCLEAALFSATVLEQHGYPPTLLSFESKDGLDHVLHVVRAEKTRGRFGAVARSRDEGLHGRRAVFRGPRELGYSYWDPYVDLTGRLTGYALVDLRELGNYDWRLGEGNLWKVERFLLDYPHRPLRGSNARYRRLYRRYRAWHALHPERSPDYHRRTESWL
jgi:hypothetical protein